MKIEELRKAQSEKHHQRLKATEEELGPALSRFARKGQ
jgi:U3 small nucleolar RNA-associated protein 7